MIIPIPSGVTGAQMAVALKTTLCYDATRCTVTEVTGSGRRLQTGGATFDVNEALNASSTASLGAPTVSTSALATPLSTSPSHSSPFELLIVRC